MDRKPHSLRKTLLFLLACTPAFAELVIHEPFDYADTGGPEGVDFLGNGNQAGGLGLGEWRHANSRGDNTNETTKAPPPPR